MIDRKHIGRITGRDDDLAIERGRRHALRGGWRGIYRLHA